MPSPRSQPGQPSVGSRFTVGPIARRHQQESPLPQVSEHRDDRAYDQGVCPKPTVHRALGQFHGRDTGGVVAPRPAPPPPEVTPTQPPYPAGTRSRPGGASRCRMFGRGHRPGRRRRCLRELLRRRVKDGRRPEFTTNCPPLPPFTLPGPSSVGRRPRHRSNCRQHVLRPRAALKGPHKPLTIGQAAGSSWQAAKVACVLPTRSFMYSYSPSGVHEQCPRCIYRPLRGVRAFGMASA